MLRIIADNIRGFFDTTIFFSMLLLGAYAILADYSYFRYLKFNKDAAVTLFIGVSLLVLPFILLIITKL
ncbi:MAG: hypothetical protein ACOZCL_00835 [Bacillota bacterium]